MSTVELAVPCFERTWEDAVTPGFFDGIARQNRFRFARRSLVVNNVRDRELVESRARERIAAGELDAVVHVADRLHGALATTGLDHAALGRIPYYTDFALVAITTASAPWLLVWDPEVALTHAGDWITPALALCERDPRVVVTNPRWSLPGVERELCETSGEWGLGYGFSDQVFLVRPERFSAPIYEHRCLASLRYPTAHIAPTFEQRVDAWMRRHRLLRATHLELAYTHPHRGTDAYRPRGILERMRRSRNRLLVRVLSRSRSSSPCRRLYWR